MMAEITTLVIVASGLLLLKYVIKRESYDFWLGGAAIGSLILIFDLLVELIPIRYYFGFDYFLAYAAIAFYAFAKMAMMKREVIKEGETPPSP